MILARRFVALRAVVVGFFVAALVAGILLPVYSDEVGWRLHERAGFDGFDKMFTRMCGPNTVAVPPFWMLPVRYYSFVFNSLFPDPLYVRLSGILYALVWTGLLLTLVWRIADDARDRVVLGTLAVGIMALGTMPLLLVWSRPEQPILLAFTAAMVISAAAWNERGGQTPARAAWLRSLAILALAFVAFSYHLKAIFLLPLLLACLIYAARGRAGHWPRIVAGLLMIAAAAWAAQYWIHRLDCPDDPSIRAMFAKNNAGINAVGAHSWQQILALIGKMFGNIAVFEYLNMPAPRPGPGSAWLAMKQIGYANSLAFFTVLTAVWSLLLLLALAAFYREAKRAWRVRAIDPRTVFALALAAAALGWSATQTHRNVYEAIFVLPMIMFAVVLVLAAACRDKAIFGLTRIAALGVGLLAIVSIPLVAAIYGQSLLRAAGDRGYVTGQQYSISVFGHHALQPDIVAAARACRIDPARGQGLLIDDVTYFTFMQSHMPEHGQGLFVPDVKRDPIAYLREIKSAGAVMSCHRFPKEYRSRLKRVGQFCCMGPPNW